MTTPDKAQELARRFYLCQGSCGGELVPPITDTELAALINTVLAEERKACAELVTDPVQHEAILARGRE